MAPGAGLGILTSSGETCPPRAFGVRNGGMPRAVDIAASNCAGTGSGDVGDPLGRAGLGDHSPSVLCGGATFSGLGKALGNRCGVDGSPTLQRRPEAPLPAGGADDAGG